MKEKRERKAHVFATELCYGSLTKPMFKIWDVDDHTKLSDYRLLVEDEDTCL